MKLLHTADWHLGKKLDRFERHKEQVEVMENLIALAEREAVDAVLVAGDLYDAFNPPTESVELFYKTVKRLAANGARPVLAIAGNHDSPDRIMAPDVLARECGVLLAGYPMAEVGAVDLPGGFSISQKAPGFVELQLPNSPHPLRVLLTPYANEYRLRRFLGLDDEEEELRQLLAHHWNSLASAYCNAEGVNVLMAHLFMGTRGEEPAAEPDDERPILHVGGAQVVYADLVPAAIQYTALGHLHRCHAVAGAAGPVVYSGSPLCYSFSEAGQEKYAIIIEAEPGQPAQWRKEPLTGGKALVRQRIEGAEAALEWLAQHPNALVELTLATDEYLTAAERKALYTAHSGIISLVPEVRRPEGGAEGDGHTIDLTQNMESLFAEYFAHRNNGQAPNAELVDLFRQVLATTNEGG